MNRKPVWFYEVKGTGGNPFWLGDAIIGATVIVPTILLCVWVCWKGIAKPLLSVFFG